MFRPMRRASRAIPEEAAKHLLQQSRRGVLAVNGDNGYPFAIPVNYYYDQEHDKIYFHGAKSGQKVDALKQNDKVCFTVYLLHVRRIVTVRQDDTFRVGRRA